MERLCAGVCRLGQMSEHERKQTKNHHTVGWPGEGSRVLMVPVWNLTPILVSYLWLLLTPGVMDVRGSRCVSQQGAITVFHNALACRVRLMPRM